MSRRVKRVGTTIAIAALVAGCGSHTRAPDTGAASPATATRTMPAREAPKVPNPPPLQAVDAPAEGPPAGPTVSFVEDKPLAFRGGAPLSLKPLAKESRIYALSPDGRSWVVEGAGEPALFSPTLPGGVRFDVSVPGAVFSADGSKLMIWGGGGLRVADVASGRILATHDRYVCAARFIGPDEIAFHEESNDPDARLLRMRIGSQPVPVGGLRAAETCRASLDGKRWFIESYGQRVYLNAETGRSFRLPLDTADQDTALSPGANRYCQAGRQGLVCTRVPDGRVERVWSRPSSTYIMTFDIEGDHALFTYASSPEGVYEHFAFVDFSAGVVRRLQGVQATSGSLFQLHPGGKLLTIGSSSGLHVYDLERGQRRFAAHRPLYGNFAFPYNPRRLVAGTDEPMDLFLVEVP